MPARLVRSEPLAPRCLRVCGSSAKNSGIFSENARDFVPFRAVLALYKHCMRGIRPQHPQRSPRPPQQDPDAPSGGAHATPRPEASSDAGPPADGSAAPDHPRPTEVVSPCASVRLTLYDVCEILDLGPHRVRALFWDVASAGVDRGDPGEAGENCLCALIDFLRQCPWRCRPTVLQRLHEVVHRALSDAQWVAPIIGELSTGYGREYQRRRQRYHPITARCLLRTSR